MELEVAGGWRHGGPTGPLRLAFEPGRPLRVAPSAAGRASPPLLALPAFANAHVHLELSRVHGETLPHADFAEWIEALVAARRAAAESDPVGAEATAAALLEGAAALLACGVSAVGEIDSGGAALATLRTTPLEGVVHRELLGPLSADRLAALDDELAREAAAPPSRLRLGLSPHAPYTAGPELYRLAFERARRHGTPVASHVAESDAEVALLRERRGPLARLFERWRFAVPEWPGVEAGLLAAIAALDPPRGFVVIHGNRLDAGEVALLAARGWPLVHCPRSWRYFGHPAPPLAAALRAGATVALGSDSRASNEGLDLWAELAAWRAADRELPDEALLDAATRGGRRALALADAGLRDGERATFQIVARRDGKAQEPSRLPAAAVRGELRTVALVIEGAFAWRAEAPA